MFERLVQLETRYEELAAQLSDPAIVNDQENYRKVSKAHRDLEETVEVYRQYRGVKQGIADAKAMLLEPDADIKRDGGGRARDAGTAADRARGADQSAASAQGPERRQEHRHRAAGRHGRRRASLFVAEMFRLYLRFAEQHRWKVEVLSQTDSDVGGLKDITAIFEGNKVYSQMKYESGVHRVQRVPATETQGRVHTSAITVAVLPEAEEVDIKIEQKDLRIDTFCSSGAGRAVCEYDILCDPDYAPADEHGGELPGREVADQEPREGDARAALAAVRGRSRACASAAGEGPQSTDRYRRPQREGPHLQLSAEPADGPPDRVDATQSGDGDGRAAAAYGGCAGCFFTPRRR